MIVKSGIRLHFAGRQHVCDRIVGYSALLFSEVASLKGWVSMGLEFAGLLYTPTLTPRSMAKTDHFYVRATVNNATAAYEQTEIDLGSFVDALGKSVLRIHSISVHFNSITDPGRPTQMGANSNNEIFWQLTTQSQTAPQNLNNKSVISTGITNFACNNAAAGLTNVDEVGDRVDQTWTDGYLIAVEQIFLGMNGGATPGWSIANDMETTMVLDCTVETLSEKAAMALALSQQ
jgi:hypothetical protein